ncbi:glycosyltransferase [Candidatus Saccharibacteria bacterium]|nr:glycosyltransferase [Candidatus Saccharibacteria bacterium]
MAKPLISLIVPIYNVEPYLGKCFSSIKNQTYQNLEIILIDDGSTDNSGKHCDLFAKDDSRVIVKHQKNAGLSSARNTGLSVARGKYVVFLDSDDYVAPDYVEYLFNLSESTNSPISVCSHYECKENGTIKPFSKNTKSSTSGIKTALEKILNEQGFILTAWGKLFSRSLFESSPKIRFPEGKLHEDVGTTYRLFIRAYKEQPGATVAFGAEPKYYYSIRSTSITNHGFDPKKLSLISQTDEMCDAIEKVFPELEPTTNLRRLHARFSILRQTNDKTITTDLTRFIKEHATWITKNPKATKRDKLALASLKLGSSTFRAAWRVYEFLFK